VKNFYTILSVTGSDSTGGSGIQADIKTIYSLGGYAVTAITAITVQTSEKIISVENIPADLVTAQVRTAFMENRAEGEKIGIEKGVEKGRIEQLVESIKNLISSGFDFDKAVEVLKVPADQIDGLRRLIFSA
jgi:hydroxymethylpyrimidine/phosphomethylpyrimidine kinase